VPEECWLPGARTFKDAGRVLVGTRGTCACGALGHDVAAYDTALTYCKQRKQFGKPLVSFQLILGHDRAWRSSTTRARRAG
jgi:glutaryl-CoA dehydrogenase